MARTVWKFPIGQSINAVAMPAGAVVRHVAVQGERIMLWAEVDSNAVADDVRTFEVAGTGWPVEQGTQFVGTVMSETGMLVFHVYEVT